MIYEKPYELSEEKIRDMLSRGCLVLDDMKFYLLSSVYNLDCRDAVDLVFDVFDRLESDLKSSMVFIFETLYDVCQTDYRINDAIGRLKLCNSWGGDSVNVEPVLYGVLERKWIIQKNKWSDSELCKKLSSIEDDIPDCYFLTSPEEIDEALSKNNLEGIAVVGLLLSSVHYSSIEQSLNQLIDEFWKVPPDYRVYLMSLFSAVYYLHRAEYRIDDCINVLDKFKHSSPDIGDYAQMYIDELVDIRNIVM
jgi:hypothetical protein